jgi:AcrR family transcriptional regulator
VSPVPKRRTQEERRTASVRKLLDAATDALIELGYAGATVQEICARAELSSGGLFRHFPTREALMVAVGEDIGQRLLASYRSKFEAIRGGDLADALALLREHCRSRLNQALYELAIASRSNSALKKALAPARVRYLDAIAALAAELVPDLADALGDRFPLLLDTILAVFDGEVVHNFIHKSPYDDERLTLLVALTKSLA